MTKENLERAIELDISIGEISEVILNIEANKKDNVGKLTLNVYFSSDDDYEEAKHALLSYLKNKLKKLQKEFNKL